ncbi:MAG: type II toxin-antitoxin system Phd/YefM family antitoxin [Gemmatimonadetes bacterium]|jgi:PHD/YefM family antitoxin component YafN of YafNO toxin-antitoxin module|nr:type II toxin-antitoxin system Phd/YefM family antitoxin [Gemmatimonadota bacterium]
MRRNERKSSPLRRCHDDRVTYSEARQKLATVLEQSKTEGEVRIKRKDGQEFVIKPAEKPESPLDIEGIDLGISAREIVGFVREVRERR